MGTTRGARVAREEIPEGEGEEVSDLGDDRAAELGRHVEATGDGYVVQVAGSSGAEVSGRERPVEVPNGEQETKPREVYGREYPVEVPNGEQMTKPSCATPVCAGDAGSDKPYEAPDDVCRDMGTTRGARVAREEIPEGDRAAELGRH